MRRRPVTYATEADLAAATRSLLEAQGWVVWPEIMGIDLVAMRGPFVMAIETKLRWCAHVLEQAWNRRELVNAVVAVVPLDQLPDPWAKPMLQASARCLGIGVAGVGDGWHRRRVRGITPYVCARVRERKSEELVSCLRPEALNHAVAGRPGSRRWSHYDATELDYVAWIQNEENHRRSLGWEPNDRSFDMDEAIRGVQPGYLGKRGQVLQRGRDMVGILIRSGRWRRLRLDGTRLSIAEGAEAIR